MTIGQGARRMNGRTLDLINLICAIAGAAVVGSAIAIALVNAAAA